MISAQKASEIYNLTQEESLMFLEISEKIEKEARLGNNSINFYTAGEHLPEEELQKIKDLGYNIYWNSPCLWYEISW